MHESESERERRAPDSDERPSDREPDASPPPFLQAGNHAVARFVATREAGLIVGDDGPPPEPGQLRVSDFRSRLAGAARGALAESLGASPWALAPARDVLGERIAELAALDARALEAELRRAVPGGGAASSAEALIAAARAEVARAAGGYAAMEAATTGPADRASSPLESAVSMAGAMFKRRGGSTRRGMLARLGRGRPLDSDLGGPLGRAFGDDFSDVRLHTDAEAGALSDSLDARAFTVGRDIVFAPGEYRPGTLVGDALIAHELAHVAQQRGSAAAEPMAKGPAGEAALEEDADVAAVHAVVGLWTGLGRRSAAFAASAMPRLRSGLQLQRCGKREQPPEPAPKQEPAVVSGPEIALDEESIGRHIVAGMLATDAALTETAGVHYAHNYLAYFRASFQVDWWEGHADEAFFERKDRWEWHLKPGVSASAAVKKWLAGLTIAECQATIIALQTDAIRAALGDAKFDEAFGNADGPGTHGPLVIAYRYDRSSIFKFIKQTDAAKRKEAGTLGHRPATVGARYYIGNHPKYLLKHPAGAYMGENAVYEGEENGV
jgi:hypothetical protein